MRLVWVYFVNSSVLMQFGLLGVLLGFWWVFRLIVTFLCSCLVLVVFI